MRWVGASDRCPAGHLPVGGYQDDASPAPLRGGVVTVVPAPHCRPSCVCGLPPHAAPSGTTTTSSTTTPATSVPDTGASGPTRRAAVAAGSRQQAAKREMNWEGLYDPELIEHYGGRWRPDGGRFSKKTVKLVLHAGR